MTRRQRERFYQELALHINPEQYKLYRLFRMAFEEVQRITGIPQHADLQVLNERTESGVLIKENPIKNDRTTHTIMTPLFGGLLNIPEEKEGEILAAFEAIPFSPYNSTAPQTPTTFYYLQCIKGERLSGFALLDEPGNLKDIDNDFLHAAEIRYEREQPHAK